MINSFSGRYRFLSNFSPAAVEFEGMSYPSSEHAYQAAKTLDRGRRWLFSVNNALSAAEAKRAGGKMPLRVDWEQVKLAVMEELVRKKFGRQDLTELLLGTGDNELIEGNTWGDTFWGICGGVGHNHLGKILMKVRAELRAGRSQLPLAVDRS